MLQAFHCALRSILQAYRAAVLCVPGNASVFGMSVLCHRLLSQIRSVCVPKQMAGCFVDCCLASDFTACWILMGLFG